MSGAQRLIDDGDNEQDCDLDDVGEYCNLNVSIVDWLGVIRPIVVALLPPFLDTPAHHSLVNKDNQEIVDSPC